WTRRGRAPASRWWVEGVVGAFSVDELVPRLADGDVVVDGGNSYYSDDIDRAGGDCGTSGAGSIPRTPARDADAHPDDGRGGATSCRGGRPGRAVRIARRGRMPESGAFLNGVRVRRVRREGLTDGPPMTPRS